MISSCNETVIAIRALTLRKPPYDWDPVSDEAVATASFFVQTLARDIACESFPWKAPYFVGQESYGGGVMLSWNHGYRLMNAYCDPDGTVQIITSDGHGLIHDIEYVGLRELTKLWRWFWNPQASWTHIWKS